MSPKEEQIIQRLKIVLGTIGLVLLSIIAYKLK